MVNLMGELAMGYLELWIRWLWLMIMIEIQARGVHQGCRPVSPNNLEGLFSHHTGRLRHSVQFSLIINERCRPIKTRVGDVIMQIANGIAERMVAMVIMLPCTHVVTLFNTTTSWEERERAWFLQTGCDQREWLPWLSCCNARRSWQFTATNLTSLQGERVSFLQTGFERERDAGCMSWVSGMARVSMDKYVTDERRIMLWCCDQLREMEGDTVAIFYLFTFEK